jgi:putative transposase
MPRRPRFEFDGGLYHLVSRGNKREAIFRDDVDRREFLLRLRRVRLQTDVEVYAFVLMPNHVHLLVRRRHVPVGKVMQAILSSYALYYHNRHGTVGHLFQGRYKALLCEDETYLLTLVRYIHRNPVRAGLSTSMRFPWSSYAAYLDQGRRSWVDTEPVLKLFGRERPLEAFRAFHEDVDPAVLREEESIRTHTGPVIGREAFRIQAAKRSGRTLGLDVRPPVSLDEALWRVLRESGLPVEPTEVRGPSRRWAAKVARARFVRLAVDHHCHSVGEVAGYLGRDPGAVRVLLHRSRGGLASGAARNTRPSGERSDLNDSQDDSDVTRS